MKLKKIKFHTRVPILVKSLKITQNIIKSLKITQNIIKLLKKL